MALHWTDLPLPFDCLLVFMYFLFNHITRSCSCPKVVISLLPAAMIQVSLHFHFAGSNILQMHISYPPVKPIPHINFTQKIWNIHMLQVILWVVTLLCSLHLQGEMKIEAAWISETLVPYHNATLHQPRRPQLETSPS
jgi:hypothetical protein